MFAVMNGIENGNSFSSNYAHLVGWGGDTEQLLEDIMNIEGDLESIMNHAKNNYFRIKGGFDEADLTSDLDGPILLDMKNDNNNFADIMKEYLSNKENNKNRVNKFVELTFPNLINKKDIKKHSEMKYIKYIIMICSLIYLNVKKELEMDF